MMICLYLFVFLSSTFLCWILARIAPKLGLIAVPGEHRQHEMPTPLVGGIAIFVVFMVALVVSGNELSLIPALALLVLTGALDDRFHLPSWVRFIAQGLAAFLMIEATGVKLESLGYLFTSESQVLLGKWSVPLTVFATIGVINAVNMSDGLDGLLACIMILVLSALFYVMPSFYLDPVTLIASLLGFLVWNLRLARPRAKIFMGDAGSMALGLVLAFLLIGASQLSDGFTPITALWLIALPLIDAVAVLIVRPLKGQSPFAADHRHYHHRLKAMGLSVNAVLVAALLLQSTCIVFGMFAMHYAIAENIQFFIFLTIFFVYLLNLFART